jgi:hypothetical protein
VSPRRGSPVLLAFLLAAVYLVWRPMSGDLARRSTVPTSSAGTVSRSAIFSGTRVITFSVAA